MRLHQVLPDAPAVVADVEIDGLAYDNRTVTPGSLFFCVPGFSRDGHDFAADAVRRGSVALVVERPLPLAVPQVRVESVRRAMAPAAANFYGDPTRKLQVVGVTGTNGKTTTAFLVRSVLEADGRQTGLLGTVTSVIGRSVHPVERTTPEAIDLQRTLRTMVDVGDIACSMEVSSHALELHRADAIHFSVAIFTNLTQDHLDFHPTMEDYFVAKRRLFIDLAPRNAVINVDDEYGARLASDLEASDLERSFERSDLERSFEASDLKRSDLKRSDLERSDLERSDLRHPQLEPPITFALDREATYRACDVHTGLDGSQFTIIGPEGAFELSSPLRGRFNVYNALGAFAAARALDVPADTAIRALEGAEPVPGRFQPVEQGQDFAVLVDYAHTPDSLENVLRAARELATGRLHVVFGCGGDRDRGKRPLMGAIAARLADRVIVTSDNPRSEDPESIVEQILVGSGPSVEHNVDRREAIEQAIAGARSGDVVVIAGKGHEQGQEFERGRKIPFDDATVAREVLRAAALAR